MISVILENGFPLIVVKMKKMLLTSVSAVWAISSFRLNLAIQTLVGSLLVVIVPIPQHTPNITSNIFNSIVLTINAGECKVETKTTSSRIRS